jgi:hypothetical protein
MGSTRIEGTVTASESGDRLAGVRVNVGGTTHRTVLGRRTDRRQASVEAGRTATLHFSLRPE